MDNSISWNHIALPGLHSSPNQLYGRTMSSFMHEDIVGRRRAERERCNDAARRSKGPLLVGYINAANYYGAPIPRHCTLSVDAVHACVSSANKRRRIKGVVFHVFKGKLDIRKKDYEQFWMPRRS